MARDEADSAEMEVHPAIVGRDFARPATLVIELLRTVRRHLEGLRRVRYMELEGFAFHT